jgi:ribosomal protein S18 acetylase RimI-like enzyme
MARVQVTSWRVSLAGLVPDAVIEELSSADAVAGFAAHWAESIGAPPTSRHRIHVAVDKPAPAPAPSPTPAPAPPSAHAPGEHEIVGFAAAGPAADEDLWPGTDGELYELHVLPSAAGAGHDERLLHAVADAFAEDGFSTAYTWALSGDRARIAFLEAAGWASDGSTANLDMGVKVPVVRLHTRL